MEQPDKGRRDLAHIVHAGELAQVARRLALGENVNGVDQLGQPLVFIAIRQQDRAMLSLLLRFGADPRSLTQDDAYPMALAAITGDLATLRLLTSQCADFLAPIDGIPCALEHAMVSGNLEVAEHLIQHGADVISNDHEGTSLLDRMAASGNAPAAKLIRSTLFDRQGLASTKYRRMATRLVDTLPDTLLRLTRQGAVSQFLEALAQQDLVLALDALRHPGVFSLTRDAAGTPLTHHAARAIPAVQRGSDSLAAWDAEAVFQALLAKREPGAASDPASGNTLLHELISLGLSETCHQLIGAKRLVQCLNLSNDNLDRPLHLAAARSQVKTIEKLTAAGADLNPVNRQGLTPLHICALNNDASAASTLIGLGANHRLRTRTGTDIRDLVGRQAEGNREFLALLDQAQRDGNHPTIFSAANPMAAMARSRHAPGHSVRC